jgi:pimeloyl-ACP methyl ester carboxylesterase
MFTRLRREMIRAWVGLALLLAGCAAPMAPPGEQVALACAGKLAPVEAAGCMAEAGQRFEAYRQDKLRLIQARSGGYRLPSAPMALLHPQRTAYSALLVHGLNDSAFYMGDLAEVLYGAGFNVVTVLLPGHGTDTRDMRDVKAEQWRAEVQAGLAMAHMVGEQVVLGGMSLGGTLAVDAVLRGEKVAGLILFVPALELRVGNQAAWLTCLPGVGDITAETEVVDSPVKYKFRAANGVCQLRRLMGDVEQRAAVGGETEQNRMAGIGRQVHVPVFLGLTFDDKRVSPRANLEFVAAVPEPVTVVTYGVPDDGLPPPRPGERVSSLSAQGLPHAYLVRRSNDFNGEHNPGFDLMAQALRGFLAAEVTHQAAP